MINIAYVIDTIETPNAGTERQLLMLMDNLDRQRFCPHLIVLRNSAWLKSNKVSFPVYDVNIPRLLSLNLIRSLINFRKYCRKSNIAIVQTFFHDANLYGTFAAYLSGIKIIISSRRNYGLGYWHNRWWLALLKNLRHMTSCYIANSAKIRDYTVVSEHVDKAKIHVIYNGLYLESFAQLKDQYASNRRLLGINAKHILIGAIANLRPIKNLALFIKVAAIAHKKYPDTRYIIVGDGAQRELLSKMIEEHSLDDVIILAGQQDDITPFLSAIDIGVLCSRSEGLSNAIIEYMAAGVPCVVSDVGGNAEAIGYKYGFTFKSDDVGEFFGKLEPLIADSQLRHDVGRAGKSYAYLKYDYKEIVKRHEEIYERYYFNSEIA